MREHRRSGAAPAVALLVALAFVYGAWPIWRALFPLEIDIDEPWNAYWADAARHGRALYPDPQSLIANNYPPLSFYVIAALSQVGLDAIAVGRILSLLATAITAIAIGICARVLGATRLGAALAGLWFVATMARFFDGYVGKNDPHLPALAISVTALAWLLRRRLHARAAQPAIVLMVLAGFYKHSLIATPIAALLWLATQDWRLGLRAALIGAAAVMAGLALCAAVFGAAFASQLLFAREHSFLWALGNLDQLQFVAPALIIWAIWAWYDRDSEAARFTTIFIAIATAFYFLQKLGMGIGVNAQFELAAATAIGLGLAFSRTMATPFAQRFGAGTSRAVIMAVVIGRLLLSNHVEPYLVLTSLEYRRLFTENAGIVAREIERVRGIPGLVHCSVMSVCRAAGKPFVYDPFAVDQKLKTGKLTPAELSATVAAERIRFEPIDARASAELTSRRLFSAIR